MSLGRRPGLLSFLASVAGRMMSEAIAMTAPDCYPPARASHPRSRHRPRWTAMRAMSQEEQAWVEQAAKGFDAVVFWTVGRYGAQPLLLPRRLWAPRRRKSAPQQRSA